MTIAVTRNTPGRFRGFLCSCMLEIAPGVYAAPRMKAAVRERVWSVMVEWAELVPEDGGVVLFWQSDNAPSGMEMRTVGYPKKELVEHEGVWLTLTSLTAAHDVEELREVAATEEPPPDADDPTLPPGPGTAFATPDDEDA
jgi:CRISPR-associated protein Cas2